MNLAKTIYPHGVKSQKEWERKFATRPEAANKWYEYIHFYIAKTKNNEINKALLQRKNNTYGFSRLH